MHRGPNRRATVAILGLAALLSACGGGGGGDSAGTAPAAGSPATGSASQTLSLTVQSKNTGLAYPIQVYLPASYRTGSTPYPVIYATDGDDAFSNPGGTRFTWFKGALEKLGTQAILVGIGNSANRQTDYNFPGANAYRSFLTDELIPLIEAQYRADAKRRVLSGLSTGGSFVLTTFLAQAPDTLSFAYFLSSEAAIWQQLGTVSAMEESLFARAAGKEIPVTLVLARSAVGGNSAVVADIHAQIASRNYRGLQLSSPSFPYGHAAMDLPAFEDAMAKLFP